MFRYFPYYNYVMTQQVRFPISKLWPWGQEMMEVSDKYGKLQCISWQSMETHGNMICKVIYLHDNLKYRM